MRLLSRAVQSLLVVFVAASLAFALLHAAPGDPYSDLGDAASMTPELQALLREQQGLDQPLAVQYRRFLGGIARGNFGYSSSQKQFVADVFRSRVPNSLLLMSLALFGSVVLGSAIGAWQGARTGSRGDRATVFTTLLVYSVPEFWLASVLLLVFVSTLHLLPSSGMITVETYDTFSPMRQLVDRLRHLVLPWLSLTLVGTAIFARFQRASMQEAMREPFVRTARAKGLAERHVRRQAWRTALLPIVTLTGLFFPTLLTGAVFVERVYAWPGIGSALVQAIFDRDKQLVTACVVVGSALTALGSLLADVARVVVDPRLRAK